MDFIDAFSGKMREKALTYEVRGLLVSGDIVYPLGTDTKVLSTVFELIIRPVMGEIAQENGLELREPTHQNYYPDFTFMLDEADKHKVAVDVKSTYRNFRPDGSWTASFTLGSYTSFLRNPTKNILFPYGDYTKHYIVGFIYTRRVPGNSNPRSLDERGNIAAPFSDVEWFVQEKYRISGERAGSGNTTNIGSVVGTSIEAFASGEGPFAAFEERVFVDYWRNYGRTKSNRPYNNLQEYWNWKA